MATQRPTFVLVPGAWHLPSTWDLLRGELDALGYASLAVRLATAGPDAHGGLAEDAAAIRAAIEGLGGPVVVVAHSYAGIPASEGLTDLPGVQHLVYLAAFVPDLGESMYTLLGAPQPESAEGLFPVSDDPKAQLYADVAPDLAEAAVSRLVDQLHQPFADRLTRQGAWRSVPSSYILTEQDASLQPAFQEQMAARTKEVRRMPTSHSPHLSSPAALATLLVELAAT